MPIQYSFSLQVSIELIYLFEMDKNSPVPKRKRYKLFLDPNYNESQVSRSTAKKWSNYFLLFIDNYLYK